MRKPSTVLNPDDPAYIADRAHAAAEKAVAKEIDALAAQFVESRARVAKLSTTAVAALADLYAGAQAHDDLVRRSAAQLREVGLVYDDAAYEDPDRTWSTGGAGNGVVMLRNHWWLPVSASSVVMRAVHGAARATAGDRADITRRVARFPGTDRLDTRPDELLKDSPLPEPHPGPQRIFAEPAEFRSTVLGNPAPSQGVTYLKWPLYH